MRMDRLTSKFQLALADAQSLAVGRDHQFIEPAHLMLALLDQEGGSARPLLDRAGVNVNLLRSRLLEQLGRIPTVEGAAGEVHPSNDLLQAAQRHRQARAEARRPVHLQRAVRARGLRGPAARSAAC